MTYVFKQEKFEGPLELLLELIEKEKLSISEVSLAKITDQYLTYLKSQERILPEMLAEFLVVAAQLILIKSRSLLPNLVLNKDEEESLEELTKRLAEYKKIREFAKEIKKLESRKRVIVSREAYAGMPSFFYPPAKITPIILERAFASFLESIPKIEKLAEESLKRIVSLEEKIKHVRAFLQGVVESAFSEIVQGSKEKIEIIVSFLAVLELSHRKFVQLEQQHPFADFKVKRI